MHSLTSSSRRSGASAALLLAIVAGVGLKLSAQQQAVPSSNINMVSGTTFPGGDPYLQRQNEPSAAVSTRNPLHLLAGANDYRTVDLPGPFDPMRGFKMAADAWVGLFKSVDGGKNWTSTLLPGFPQDSNSSETLKPYEGATDPVVRAGTNGLFYFAGVAFTRGPSQPSAIFVARYMDLNNVEAGDPFGYVGTNRVDWDTGARFLDKVALATDIPRSGATCTITSKQVHPREETPTTRDETIPAGNVYVAYAAFTGSAATEQSVIMLSRSTNCGATWSAPIALSTGSRLVQNPQIAVSPTDGAVYVSWRRFKYSTQDDAVMIVKSVNGGATFSKPLRVSGVNPFDQGTSGTSFRSNGFQTMAIDATGRVYLAWPGRGYATLRNDPATGDSRIVVSTSTTGATWTVPRAIQPAGIGHQLMPAMSFHGGKLRILYYDLREDVSGLFGPYIDELPILNGPIPRIRHTIDVFVAQASPGGSPAFTTARVSEYASGFLPGSTVEQRLQFNPPNLPLFRQGAVPFMGDYIDLAPAPSFVVNENGTWSFNTGASGSVVSHAVWTDNRDVRPPADGNWANYTPVTSPAVGTQSRFDPTQQVPGCVPGQVGMRNQNIYTARVTDGLFVSAPGNNKQFSGFQRAFVVVAENASVLPRTYRLIIENQPLGGQASFLQFGPALTTLDVSTPALSSIARTVFVTAQDQNARISVSVTEINGVGGTVVTNGLTGTVVLNPDPQNPVLQNPVLQNPVLQNPVLQNISQGESYDPAISFALVGVPNLQNPVLQNPNLQNPNLQNPSLQNPHLQNPNLQNPTLQNPVLQNDAVANPSIINADLTNPNLQNPVLQNPNLQNPTLQNPNLQNAGFSDTNWVVTNGGNTTASYTVNLLLNTPVPAGFSTQLLLHKTFTTPAADGCELKEQQHTILLANIPNPQFVTDPTNPNLQNPNLQNPNLQNPTLALAPGESATVTLRVLDPNIFDGVTYDASAAVTPAAVAQSVNTDDVAAGDTTPSVALPLTITTSEIPPTTPGAPINRTLGMVAATGTVSCFVVPGLGALPGGVTLSSSGTLSGTPTTPGNYVFTVECVDSGPPERRDRQTLTIQVNPASAVGFDALWNGLDSNWYNPANWSPRGVPAETSRVYLSAATSVVPRLTANVTVRDLFLEPGAQLDTNGFTLTVTNNADAGRTIVGLGQTVLTGSGSTAGGVFSNLVIAGRITLSAPLTTTGTLTLAAGARLELNGQPLIVGGQLITDASGGTLPMVVAAAVNSFIVTGVNVNGLVLNGAPLTINGAALTRFDNVSFSGFAPEAIQLTVNNPGLLTHLPMNGLSFSSQPTSGQYVSATDTQPGGALLILDVTGAVPADGSAFTVQSGGAEVNWVGNPGEANLAVTQIVAPVPAAVGTRLTYQITVTNGGPAAAADVVLNEQVPLGATGVLTSTPQGSCTPGPIGVSCALGTLAAGTSVQATVSFLTTLTGTLSTTAVVTSTTPDAVIANNSHTIGATIVPAGQGVDLRLTKTDSIDPVALNAPFTYTLTVTNVGTTEATNVVVTDNMPSGIEITYATSASGMCSAIGSQVLCSFALILPGETVSMTFNVAGKTVGAWTNQASVTSAQIELTPADNVVSEATMVIAAVNCTAPSFSGPTIFAANGPTGDVLTGDLNGDGFKDVMAPVPSANSVAVLLGNGTGGFGAPTLYPTGTGTHEGVILDLNGDGRLDIALEGFVDAFVLFGNGTGGFGAATTISYAPAIVGDIRAGDFNGDGQPDLALTTLGPNQLHVRLNNGTGGFVEAVTPIALPGEADRIVVQDLNGDARPDLALSYTSFNGGQPANLVSILLGDGAGGFGAPATLPLAANAESRVFGLGDVNGDTHTDLAVIETLSNSRTVYVLLGNGAGSFTAQPLTSALAQAFRVEAGDINGDDRKDLAVSGGNVLNVFLGDGLGGFAQSGAFSIPFGLNFQLVDLNGDSRLDIASALNQDNGVTILLNGCNQATGTLVLSAFDSPDPVDEGTALTYSSTVTNTGATLAANVALTQTLSALGAAGTVTSSQGACTITDRLVTCNLGPLTPNASADVQVTFTPSAGGLLSSVIAVGSERPDSNPADNVVTLTTTVTAAGSELVVTNTNNAGAGSLRQAILDSNADTGDRDTIVFSIPGSGVRTITLLSALPQITEPVVIDATTQTGYAGTPLIELNGNGLVAIGLNLLAGNSEVRGLVINRFGGAGIFLQANGGNVVDGNYVGTDATGTVRQANSGHGILVLSANNRIGGPGVARNLISGNGGTGIKLETAAATANLIEGNYIGVNASGFGAIGNGDSGIAFENGPSGNTIGGLSSTGGGNVISGNDEPGILFVGANVTGNIIIGNRIGTDSLGTTSIANGGDGIHIASGSGNVIGGTAVGTGNLISGNAQNGVSISAPAAANNTVLNNLIGTNNSGMSAIGNGANGVVITDSGANTIGVANGGNVISGNGRNGIAIFGVASIGNQIYGNSIGANFQATGPIGNQQDGVRIDSAVTTIVGGADEPLRNVIGGNVQHGVGLYDGASGTRIAGNTIGFGAPLTFLGNNLEGIQVNNASNTTIGGPQPEQANLISHNGRNGVSVIAGTHNLIEGNRIFGNTALGIDLGNDGVTANDTGDGDIGPNSLQNFPVLTGVVGGVQGILDSTPGSGFLLEYYGNAACDASQHGEGETFLGSALVLTDANGNATIPLFPAPAGQVVTATATGGNGDGDTSEFSACVTVPAAPPQADLTLTMTDSADPVAFGAPFNYVLTAQNLGPQPAVGVQLTDTLPAGLTATVASASEGTCTIATSSVTCNIGTLGVNATATITITVTSSVSGTLTNSASIISELQDPVPGNNSDSEQTTIELASCSGVTFTGPTPYAGSAGPMAVVRLVDMNHDGRLDAVTTHEEGSKGVDVFLNDGAGHFAAPRFTSTVTGPWMQVTADFNGDTHPDVITASDRTAPGNPITLRLLANDGTGTLTLVPSFSIPFGGHFTAVDLDRDGDQDLVIATTTGGFGLLRNDGQGNFAAPETILADASGFVTFADFNGDNRTDMVAALGASGFAVVLADGTGGFLPPVVHTISGGAHAAADPVDLNGDGRLDLLIIAGDDNGPTQGVSVVFGNGTGGFGAPVQAISDFLYWPTLTDVNGDGRPDLVGISTLGSIGVWRGNGGASFSAPVHFPNAVYYGPVVGDLNGDGRPDIATGDINGTLNVFLHNCGAAPTNLSVAVTESADPVNEDGELTYTVTVTNPTATDAVGVRLTSVLSQLVDDDPVLPAITVLDATSSAGGSLTTAGATFVWSLPTLAANGTATFTFRFRPLAGGTLEFTTGVSSEGTETDPSDNAAHESTIVNATGSTLAVTTTADDGPGSLRQAIEASNADSGDRDTIVFNIPGAGVPTITLQSGLPLIDQPVVIDGTTQPATAQVELNGNGLTATGLVIAGGNSIVRGLVINGFNFDAISLESNGGNVVEGNLIGTDPTGNVARPNGSGGIRVFSANNRIGGVTAASRNVISGNQQSGVTLQNATATGNVVQGNYIGLNAAGNAALPNGGGVGGIQIFNGARGNTLGGALAGAGNVVSGNTGGGISVNGAAANDNLVQGNLIGTDPTGAVRIANGQIGVDVISAQRTIVGGPGLARNVISGNGTGIQIRTNASGTLVQNNYIGLNASGTAALFNGVGISINSNAVGNTIGGSTVGLGNVISGNNGVGINVQMGSNNTIIQGNYIGLNAAGNQALGNTGIGINLGTVSGTIIGGTTAGAGNVISGNTGSGINDGNSNGTVIQGNLIGLDAGGGVDLGNGGDGINSNGVSGTIGGTAAGARNVISGNNNAGIRIRGSATANVVRGNYIGVNATGGAAVGNTISGVTIQASSGNTIGGTAVGEGNLISGNGGAGITVESPANGNVIQGNLIGLDAAGTQALGNGTDGIRLNSVSGTIIGGTTVGAGNVISGNAAYGINNAAGSTGTVIHGNRIGTNAAGSDPVPNGVSGLFVDGNGTTIGGTAAGATNVIAHNALNGVNVAGGTGHAIVGNSIFSNGALGINLGPAGVTANDAGDGDAGANNHQNYPVLAAAAGGVQGTFNSTPNGTFTIHYYGNTACNPSQNGEGETFLGGMSVTTDANGNATLPLFSAAAGLIVTATATSATNDTSEFSACVTAAASNRAPTSNAGPDQTVYLGSVVTLEGSGSDADGDQLTYAWSFTSRPTGSEAALSNATSPSSTFNPDVPGTYSVALVVDDGTESSVADSVSITVLSNQIALALGGAQVVGVTREAPVRATLPFAAPAGGTTVTLMSANPGFLSIIAPGTAFIAEGLTIGQIMVRGEGSGTALLRANATGYGQGTLSVLVTHNLISTPSTLNVAFGGSTALPITIGPDPAPAGGLTLDVASSDADIEVLTPQVMVPAGALSVNATVRGARVGTANVTVSNTNYAPATTVVTSRAELNIVQTSASFNHGLTPPTITLRLESNGTQIAAQPALTVTLTPANPGCVTVPSSVTIPAGLVSTSFSPAYGGTATLPCTTTVAASATDVTPDTVSITVNRPPEIVAGGTVSVGAGLIASASASVSAAQHGGVDVTITAGTQAQPGPVRVSRTASEVGAQSFTVHLNNGQTSIPYYVHGLESTTGSSTIALTAEGLTGDSHTVDLVQPAVDVQGLTGSMNTLSGPDTDLYVQVGITHPSYNNAQLWQTQNVRPGSPGFEVTLTNSNSTVGRLRSDEPAATGGQTGQVVKKTITAGTYYTHAITTGTSYGFAFEPLGTGTTTVTVTAPGALTMTSTGVRQVQVTSPVINAGGTVSVGAGLIASASASLSAAQHGGVDVIITAGTQAQPGPVRLSRTATEIGTQSITVRVNNGQTSIPYYVHGLENTTGSSTITLTTERFTSGSHSVDIVQPAVDVQGLTASMNTLSGPDTDLYVQVGITHPSYNNAQLWQTQNVRPGSPGFEVTLTNSNSTVARLRSDEPAATGGQTAQVVKKTITAGTYYTHAITTGTSYGFAFDPLGTGTTTVTVSAPGALTMTSTGVRQVQVTSPVINAGGTVSVGAGLISSASASLSAAQHGGVDVTITAGTAAQPGPARLSRTATDVGTQSITVHLNNGETYLPYYVHGLENTTGSSTITLTTERFTTGSHSVDVVQPGVELQQLSGSFTNLSADDTDVYVQVGITHPSYNNAQLWQTQNVRPGSPGLVVTLSNSNANVARLRSDEPVGTGQVAQAVTKTINAGTYYTHALTSGTTYGFAFEPLSNGSTTVTVTAPGALTMTSTGVRPVTVSTPAISVTDTLTIGAGLMQDISATLGAPLHGGVDVTITSSASVVLVSSNSTTAGTASTVVHVSNSQTSVPFVVHGLENVSATAVVTLSAPGFTSKTMSVTVTPASVEILNLPTSISEAAADDTDMYVQVGITHPSYNNSQLWQAQNVRAGSPGLIVTLTVDNPARARLRSDEPEATGHTVTKPIRPGTYYTQRIIQSGTSYGLAFDPISQGTVVVTATGPPGTLPLDSSQRAVVINPVAGAPLQKSRPAK